MKFSFRVNRREVFALFTFYFLFSLLYHVVLWYLTFEYSDDVWGDLISVSEWWEHSGLQYVQFFVASGFIWLVGIYALRHRPQWQQLLMVVLLLFPAVYLARESRYWWLDRNDGWHLEGYNAVWDIYIPLLFLMVQFGAYFAYVNYREHQRKLRAEGELKQAALKSELAAIKAQLNPHFLYNVFNTINASLPAGSENAREMVSRLSDLFRYQLRATREDLVPLADELKFVSTYLDLEHARFGDRLKVVINVLPELMDRQVPPMLLQPLVENSIKHGLSSLIEGGKISIDVFESADKLHFRIADTGIGASDKSRLFGTGVGLTNTRLRLEKMYGAALEIMDNQPRGLIIQFAL